MTDFKYKPGDFDGYATAPHLAAARANAILQEHIRTLPVVYGINEPELYFCVERCEATDTHTALLFDVKEIEK